MKRVVLTTTSLVFAGGMAVADVAVTGSAEMGVSGNSGPIDADDTSVKGTRLHKDLEVKFTLSGATDTGLSFGGSIDLDEAATKAGSATVHVGGAFGTLTLGDTDSAYDKALTEVGAATAIADDHTGHAGYNGNSGLKGFANNGGHSLRYDYSLGGVTVSASSEVDSADSNNSTGALGVAWAGDVGGIAMGVGLGFQSGRKNVAAVAGVNGIAADGSAIVVSAEDGIALTPAARTGDIVAPTAAADAQSHKANIVGMSASADMGNGFSIVANYSRKNHETIKGAVDVITATTTRGTFTGGVDTDVTVAHYGVGIAYTTGALTIGANGGSSTTRTTGAMATIPTGQTAAAETDPVAIGTSETTASGAGIGVVYGLGEGVSFQAGVGSGKKGATKKTSWSAGLSFSF